MDNKINIWGVAKSAIPKTQVSLLKYSSLFWMIWGTPWLGYLHIYTTNQPTNQPGVVQKKNVEPPSPVELCGHIADQLRAHGLKQHQSDSPSSATSLGVNSVNPCRRYIDMDLKLMGD